MIPKTWENPKAEHPEMKAFGDNDPVRIHHPSFPPTSQSLNLFSSQSLNLSSPPHNFSTSYLSTSQPLNLSTSQYEIPSPVIRHPKFEAQNSKTGIVRAWCHSTLDPRPWMMSPKPQILNYKPG